MFAVEDGRRGRYHDAISVFPTAGISVLPATEQTSAALTAAAHAPPCSGPRRCSGPADYFLGSASIHPPLQVEQRGSIPTHPRSVSLLQLQQKAPRWTPLQFGHQVRQTTPRQVCWPLSYLLCKTEIPIPDLSYLAICTRFPISTGEWQQAGHAVNGAAATCTRSILCTRHCLVSVSISVVC
jgi:hypothetical protein